MSRSLDAAWWALAVFIIVMQFLSIRRWKKLLAQASTQIVQTAQELVKQRARYANLEAEYTAVCWAQHQIDASPVSELTEDQRRARIAPRVRILVPPAIGDQWPPQFAGRAQRCVQVPLARQGAPVDDAGIQQPILSTDEREALQRSFEVKKE